MNPAFKARLTEILKARLKANPAWWGLPIKEGDRVFINKEIALSAMAAAVREFLEAQVSEENVRAAFHRFMGEAENPCSASAMREALTAVRDAQVKELFE